MAAPRKRTAKKTTSSRSRTPAKSGRSSSSFVAMGILAGLAIAILFYTIVIRQDANLTKGNVPQYAHTPEQTNVLNPLPPRPRQESAPTSAPTTSPAPTLAQTPSEPPLSIAESLAQQNAPQSTSTPPSNPNATEAPKSTAQAKAPSPQSAPAKQTAPQPSMTEDTIGKLIAQNQKSAPASASTKSTATPKDDADHLGALISTIPSASSSTNSTSTSSNNTDTSSANKVTKTPTTVSKQNSSVNAVPEKTIALNPVPTKERPLYLQTASYKTENEADAMRAELLLAGHSTANVRKALVNNKTVYRVRIGPYTSSSEFEKAQKNLEATKLKLSPVR